MSLGKADRWADDREDWRAAALAFLSIRFIQGFIYWGGGSRRFIYAPSKLDPHAKEWMANKFQSAMPGALFGFDHIVDYMLRHFWLLYAGIIVFSGVELIFGLFLIVGLFTRLSALVSVGLSIVLMILFGWQGATCIDEWTMAACNLAIGASLVLAGSGAFSLDSLWFRRRPRLAQRRWFRWSTGALPLPLDSKTFTALALATASFTALFNVATYNHYRGSVYSAFHKGPVSPSTHHYTISQAELSQDGRLGFSIYLDGGTADVPSHIVRATLEAGDGKVLERWDMQDLSRLNPGDIRNDYAYNKITVGPFGLEAAMGARARLTLHAPDAAVTVQKVTLSVTTVSGHTFEAPVTVHRS